MGGENPSYDFFFSVTMNKMQALNLYSAYVDFEPASIDPLICLISLDSKFPGAVFTVPFKCFVLTNYAKFKQIPSDIKGV